MHRSLLTGGRYIYFTHMDGIYVCIKIVTFVVRTCAVSRVLFVLCRKAE